MRKILFATIALACISCFLCLHTGNSRASDIKTTVEPFIVFGDTNHAAYFRYQTYKIAHGEVGYTKAAWNNLRPEERLSQLAKGEADLSNIRATLLAKLTPTPKEIELFAAVWGSDAKPVVPADDIFSKYKQYMLAQGQAVDALDSMTADEQNKKIAEYGVFLESLKKELAAKPVLNTREVALYEAVWGHTETDKKPAEIVREKEIKEKLEANHTKKLEDTSAGKFSQDLPQYQKNGNWDKFFDGSANKKGSVDLSGNIVSNSASKPTVPVVIKEQKQQAISMPPLKNQSQAPEPSGKTGLVIGGVLFALGALAVGAKKLANRTKQMAPDEFDLDVRIQENSVPSVARELSKTGNFCQDCPSHSCPKDTCPATCGGTCQTCSVCTQCNACACGASKSCQDTKTTGPC